MIVIVVVVVVVVVVVEVALHGSRWPGGAVAIQRWTYDLSFASHAFNYYSITHFEYRVKSHYLSS